MHDRCTNQRGGTEAGIALKPRGTPRGCASQWGNARGRAGEDEGRAAHRRRTDEGAVRADLRDAPAARAHDEAAAARRRNAAGRWVGSNGAGGNNIRGCTGRLVPVSRPDCWAGRDWRQKPCNGSFDAGSAADCLGPSPHLGWKPVRGASALHHLLLDPDVSTGGCKRPSPGAACAAPPSSAPGSRGKLQTNQRLKAQCGARDYRVQKNPSSPEKTG
jgi:hypothetical protein